MSSDRIWADGLRACTGACSFSGLRNFHSSRYRACSGGSSVDQLNTTSSSRSCREIGVWNGDASAVIDVAIPHTKGCNLAGNTTVMLSLRVGSRMARDHHGPHLRAGTEYR